MSPDVFVSVVTDVVAAMDQIKRDRERVYAGIILEHDLQEELTVASSMYLCGNDVVNVVIANIDKSVPILVHSMNPSQAVVMARLLESKGFANTRIPISELTEKKLFEWVQDARKLWEELKKVL